MARPNRQPQGLQTQCVYRGQYGRVWLSDEAKAEYDALCARTDETGIREAAKIRRYFDRFAALGPGGLDDPKMLKRQGRMNDERGRPVTVFAIKAYQWRVYGVLQNYKGARAFVGLCVDPDKKQDKADRALLARCARMAGRL